MGKYNRSYEQYYRKMTGNNTEDEFSSSVTKRYDIESRARNIRGNKKQKGPIIFKIACTTVVLIGICAGGIYLCKDNFGETGKYIYSSYEKVVSKFDGVKNYFVSLGDNLGSNTKKDENEKLDEQIDNELKKQKESLEKNTLDTSNDKSAAVSSFVINDDNVNKEGSIEKTASLDSSTKAITESIKNLKIKTKSDAGVVIECKDEIIKIGDDGEIIDVGEKQEGFYVILKHSNNTESHYYNLKDTKLKKSDKLKKGDNIVEIKGENEIVYKLKKNGEFINPKEYL